MNYSLQDLLNICKKKNASDLHLTAGLPPVFRIKKRLVPLKSEPLTSEEVEELVYPIMNDEQKEKFKEEWEIDFSFGVHNVGRFRVNVFRQRQTVAAAFRVIPWEIPTFEQLGLPKAINKVVELEKGFVLVTGATGSGKSTTLASVIDKINSTRSVHIITIEDPIEYLHKHKKSIVVQRELGSDTRSFPKALRSVLREDPDVILVGEMRDLETISSAITAAETGHLVFATLHTNSAAQSIDRIVDVFPPHQQQQIRIQLSNVLSAIFTQQLVERRDGSGLVLASEVLIVTPAVRNLIRENKSYQINTIIQTSKDLGMQTMNQALKDLYEHNLISFETAIRYSYDPSELLKMLGREDISGSI